jgi:hypothetical protein
LKKELLQLTGRERISLSPEQRRLLLEKAKGIDLQVLKEICLFDLQDFYPPSPNDTSAESS